MQKKKSHFIFKKIYIGFIIFFIALFFFFLMSYLDKTNNFPFFVPFSLFICSLLFNLKASKEFLDSTTTKPKNKNKSLYKIIIFLCFCNFCCFCSFIIKFLETKKDFIFSVIVKDYKKDYIFSVIFKDYFDYFLFFFLLGILFVFFLFLFKKEFDIFYLNCFCFISLYIAFFSSCFYSLIIFNQKWFFYIFLITIISDSFAFVGGRLFGKNFLCSSLSPNKTWEGFFSGIIFTLILVLFFFPLKEEIKSYTYFIIFTIFCSIIAQFGDLIASKIKRNLKIKDFGNIFLEHGGLLDRFDSLLFLSFFIILILFGIPILGIESFMDIINIE
ncbi:phosphatidate cytidylyltransferase [Candidatus Phytoplasma pini]|uniref:Phosphatidate cytidylyltransferase n=1 Tax=Candidatus Phytoplasma pini TaxID=267362 RepID=A0A559KJZ2_9MOLU|nr:phosphatidate cytidylyltransferase [Candidatus Phytoplasma pini]TVY12427.1 phosphatidate cytidylyltransferase [Candidatus Phytoplasma pini]